jgi:MFS family permease
MAARNESSSTHVLLIILLIITCPVWFALAAALFGIAAGVFGAFMGVVGAIFGVFGTVLGGLMSLIALPFKILFGGWHDGWHWFPHFHFNTLAMIAVIIVVALIVKNRK